MALSPLFLCFVLLVTSSVSGRFVVEKSSITVISPSDLQSKHDSAIGNFGVPDYGGTMVGAVVYPDKSSASGCRAFSGDRPFKSRSSRPIFLLLDRGECYFALKVWNGQQAGVAAVLVADSIDEPLITMDSPEENSDKEGFVNKINIPSALIDRSFGDSLKKALQKGEEVIIKLDWRESMPHPDERVEYELWTNSNDECGSRCDEQMRFVKDFKGHAQILERGGYTQFTPHYITWYCPEAFILSKQCKSQCINHGRYCAPDPEQDFGEGYEGKQVVFENLRQLCVHRVANESHRSWVWWDFVTDFHIRCSMKEKRYSIECAENVIKSLGLPLEKIKKCMGDPEADVENPVLKAEQELQVFPSFIRRHPKKLNSVNAFNFKSSFRMHRMAFRSMLNANQKRVLIIGKLERTAVLRAVCAGFAETTEPAVCLSADIETNECLERNGGCWMDSRANVTACKDTFRGRVCECPAVNGVQYRGDGYTSCEDMNECKDKTVCQCDGCSCKNTWGGYDCKCRGDRLYIADQDTCIGRNTSRFGWFLTLLVLGGVVGLALAGYIFYKYRLRATLDILFRPIFVQSYMDSEIMAIMSQYMPLDNQNNETEPLRQRQSSSV
ncbi:hypothetical protein Syun_008277 [Stephania yunnanensis]|uniref:EGF-like calcium-binding domain-containing protein n=1 Tax=Stephania yunnanensis TaxID=152371 RepID=A0AAP0KC83_9MAGN